MEKSCKVVIFSDLHYTPKMANKSEKITKRKLTQYSLPIIDRLIDTINNEIKPDIVFNLGDLIEDEDKEKDIQNLKFIWEKLKNIQSPFYTATGNHDLRKIKDRKIVEGIFGYKNSSFSVDVNGYHFVVLGLDYRDDIMGDEGQMGSVQYISQQDLNWLENDLKQNKNPTIILTHLGVAEDNMERNYWTEGNNKRALLANRAELKKILKSNSNIVAVFCAHQHWNKYHVQDGINYYVLGSLIENILDDGIPDGVYFEITLHGNDISILENRIRI